MQHRKLVRLQYDVVVATCTSIADSSAVAKLWQKLSEFIHELTNCYILY